MDIYGEIEKIGIVPVVVMDEPDDAAQLAKALSDGGVPCAEVTFRTPRAAEVIKKMTEAYPEMLVGAGTVLNVEQAKKAIAAGATFIVSPGLNPEVVTYCKEQNVVVIPGCANPTNVEEAMRLGLDVVKFFPAEQAGGLSMMKAMSAPYPGIRFMPTGGISEKNLFDYASYNKVVACGGSFMVKKDFLEKKDFFQVMELTKKAVDIMLNVKLVEIKKFDGENRIVMSANNLKRVMYHWAKRGLEFDVDSIVYQKDQIQSVVGYTLEHDVTIQFIAQ
ncbi:MAG: bifunctional 4-hydroxy-2-oxoglutarate aldolase/2-dehydro-3-deoxy-phosphogluconate aldolase [Eubacteriales bacterium]|nr:bifunctional 4-hydroxy-2-oxoglutarate aldolase/2-dehydro-3-deoxy-phosphogluconate aldolase [Eubacteriales bacterium]